jgi:hypothetical protein
VAIIAPERGLHFGPHHLGGAGGKPLTLQDAMSRKDEQTMRLMIELDVAGLLTPQSQDRLRQLKEKFRRAKMRAKKKADAPNIPNGWMV